MVTYARKVTMVSRPRLLGTSTNVVTPLVDHPTPTLWTSPHRHTYYSVPDPKTDPRHR